MAFGNIRKMWVELGTRYDRRGFEDATRAVNKLGSAAKLAATSLQIKTIGQLAWFGGAAAVVGGLGYAFRQVAQEGQQFEKAMSGVRAVAQPTVADFKILEDQARDLGKQTVFTATEAAKAMEELGKAGFTTNEILGTMPEVLDLAAAGELSMAEAAQVAASLLKALGEDVSEFGTAVDVVAKTAVSSVTTVSELGESYKYVASVARETGTPIQELNALLGILANRGIRGSMAGTALRRSFSVLLGDLQAGEKGLSKFNIQAFDTRGNFVGMANVIRQFREQGVSAIDIMEAFGQRAGPAMLQLFGAGADEIERFTSVLDESFGEASRLASERIDNLWGDTKKFNAALTEMGLVFYQALAPALRDMVQGSTDLINKWSELIDSGNLFRGISKVVTILKTALTALLAYGIIKLVAWMGKVYLSARLWGMELAKGNILLQFRNKIMSEYLFNLAAAAEATKDYALAESLLNKAAAATTGQMTFTLKSLGLVASMAGIAGAAFAGWQIGTLISDLTGLGGALTNLYEDVLQTNESWKKFIETVQRLPGGKELIGPGEFRYASQEVQNVGEDVKMIRHHLGGVNEDVEKIGLTVESALAGRLEKTIKGLEVRGQFLKPHQIAELEAARKKLSELTEVAPDAFNWQVGPTTANKIRELQKTVEDISGEWLIEFKVEKDVTPSIGDVLADIESIYVVANAMQDTSGGLLQALMMISQIEFEGYPELDRQVQQARQLSKELISASWAEQRATAEGFPQQQVAYLRVVRGQLEQLAGEAINELIKEAARLNVEIPVKVLLDSEGLDADLKKTFEQAFTAKATQEAWRRGLGAPAPGAVRFPEPFSDEAAAQIKAIKEYSEALNQARLDRLVKGLQQVRPLTRELRTDVDHITDTLKTLSPAQYAVAVEVLEQSLGKGAPRTLENWEAVWADVVKALETDSKKLQREAREIAEGLKLIENRFKQVGLATKSMGDDLAVELNKIGRAAEKAGVSQETALLSFFPQILKSAVGQMQAVGKLTDKFKEEIAKLPEAARNAIYGVTEAMQDLPEAFREQLPVFKLFLKDLGLSEKFTFKFDVEADIRKLEYMLQKAEELGQPIDMEGDIGRELRQRFAPSLELLPPEQAEELEVMLSAIGITYRDLPKEATELSVEVNKYDWTVQWDKLAEEARKRIEAGFFKARGTPVFLDETVKQIHRYRQQVDLTLPQQAHLSEQIKEALSYIKRMVPEFAELPPIVKDIAEDMIRAGGAEGGEKLLDTFKELTTVFDEFENELAAMDDIVLKERRAEIELLINEEDWESLRELIREITTNFQGMQFNVTTLDEVMQAWVENGADGLERLAAEMKANGSQLQTFTEQFNQQMRQIGVDSALGLGDALVDAFDRGAESMKEFFKQLLLDITKAIVRASILQSILQGGPLGFLGGLLGGGGGASAAAYGGGYRFGGVIQNAQSGWLVPGIDKGRDTVPAMLQPGELVLPVKLTKELLQVIRQPGQRKQMSFFKEGGIVDKDKTTTERMLSTLVILQKGALIERELSRQLESINTSSVMAFQHGGVVPDVRNEPIVINESSKALVQTFSRGGMALTRSNDLAVIDKSSHSLAQSLSRGGLVLNSMRGDDNTWVVAQTYQRGGLVELREELVEQALVRSDMPVLQQRALTTTNGALDVPGSVALNEPDPPNLNITIQAIDSKDVRRWFEDNHEHLARALRVANRRYTLMR